MIRARPLPVLLAIAGILLFSTKSVFVKLAYAGGADSLSTLLMRMLFALPVYLSVWFGPGRKVTEGLQRKDYLQVLFFGIIGYYLASYFDFKGLVYIKASLERLILFIYPTLVILISYVFLNKEITRTQIFGVVITYLGICLVFVPETQLDGGHDVFVGAGFVFLSALCYSGYIVGSSFMTARFGVRNFTTLVMIVSCLFVVVHYSVESGDFGKLFTFDSRVYFAVVAMAILSTVLPSYLISYAIHTLGAPRFSIFGSLGPVSTIFLAYFILDERLTTIQFAGGLIVISGVAFAEFYRKKPTASL